MSITDTLTALARHADWWRKKAAEMRAKADMEALAGLATAAHDAARRGGICDRHAEEIEHAIRHLSAKSKRAGFIPPTGAEAKAHFTFIGMTEFEAERFVAHYESNGWRVGKNPMKDWKAAARSWRARLLAERPGAVNRENDHEPAGWRAWLKSKGHSYVAYKNAPQFLRAEFKS